MIDHNEIQELLTAFALGELSSEESGIVAEHLTQCELCRLGVESIRLVLECACQMSEVSVDENMCVSAKEGLMSSLLPAKTETETVAGPKGHAIRWRTIMQSKVTKFAAAAVLILGVFLGLYALGISPDGSSVAWASLAQHVEQIKTVTYRMHMTMKGMPGLPKDKMMEVDQVMTMSSDYGMKMEMMMDGKVMSQMYMPIAGQSIITLMPEQKMFMKITLTDEMQKKTEQQSYDPREVVAGFMGTEYMEIGRKEINGVVVEGVETNNSIFAGMPFNIIKGQLWVDVNTDLPVLLEMQIEMKTGDAVISTTMVIDSFQWNIELDESEFICDIPEDYEEMPEMKIPEMNAEAAIEGFKLLTEIKDGKFPKTLNMMDIISDASEFSMKKLTQERQAREKTIEEAEAAGIDPNTIPGFQPEKKQQVIQGELANNMLKIQGICVFNMGLVQEKKDPAYYGDRITPADSEMILMRWQNDKGGYTVIFGDLSTGDFSAEEVGEMEAKLPEILTE